MRLLVNAIVFLACLNSQVAAQESIVLITPRDAPDVPVTKHHYLESASFSVDGSRLAINDRNVVFKFRISMSFTNG